MTVSIIAALLIVWQVLAGFARGAIRSIANLAGLLGAIFLSPLLGKYLEPLVVKYVTENPVWQRSVSVACAALGLWLVCYILGRLIHHFVTIDEPFWSFGLNKKLGLFIGFVEGLVLAGAFLWMIYFFGTAAWMFLPVAEGQGRAVAPQGTVASFLINARADLLASKIGQNFALIDPTPQEAYDAVKLLGQCAEQPAKRDRLQEYPGFRHLMQIKSINDAINDPQVQRAVQEKRPVTYLLTNSKIQTLAQDKESREALINFDWTGALKFVNSTPPRGR